MFCRWPITRRHFVLTTGELFQVSETTIDATVQRLCQREGTEPIPPGNNQFFRPPRITLTEVPGHCSCRESFEFNFDTQWCEDSFKPDKVIPDKNTCPKSKQGDGTSTPNPCNAATGNKHRSEPDIISGALTFSRSYNSQALANVGLG